MKKISKKIVLLLITVFFIAGVPYLKTPCNCGAVIPLAFTGAIFGCGGEKEDTKNTEVNENATAVAAEKQTAATEMKGELKVTFVELGSVNCIPCRMMQPVMEKVEKTYPGQVKVVFHDVWTDKGRSEGFKFGVRVIPTQVFLDKNGKEYFRHEGFFPFEEVDKILKQMGVK